MQTPHTKSFEHWHILISFNDKLIVKSIRATITYLPITQKNKKKNT